MNYSIATISTIINAISDDGSKNLIRGNGDTTAIIKDLLIDSRKVNNPSSSLFFAIKGDRHDGHTYINDLYKNGVRNFIVSVLPNNIGDLNQANFILVNDTLRALQTLCAHHRQQFKFPVIGITGSNGKTIVKEWLYQLLQNDKNIVRSPKSFNSQVGVPLSVWNINETNNLGVFEAGISKKNEMKLLESIIQPTIGLITNLREAHD